MSKSMKVIDCYASRTYHLETPNCVVNVTTGLHDNQHREVTSVEILGSELKGEESRIIESESVLTRSLMVAVTTCPQEVKANREFREKMAQEASRVEPVPQTETPSIPTVAIGERCDLIDPDDDEFNDGPWTIVEIGEGERQIKIQSETDDDVTKWVRPYDVSLYCDGESAILLNRYINGLKAEIEQQKRTIKGLRDLATDMQSALTDANDYVRAQEPEPDDEDETLLSETIHGLVMADLTKVGQDG